MPDNVIKSDVKKVFLNRDAVEAIETILRRGNNAIVKRHKDGVCVSEEYQKIKYRTTQRGE